MTCRCPCSSGRLPARAGETTLGSREARRLGAEVGDRVVLRTYDDEGRRVPRSLRVVGVAVTPDLSDEGLGGAVLLWPGDLRRAVRTVAFPNGLVEVEPGVDVDALYRDLSARLEMGRATQPAQVRNLAALGRLPAGLAVFLAVIAVVVLAHSLVLTVRRRSADLAVLRVIGLTPRQVAASVGVMAVTLTAIGLVAGPVLGLAIGRVVWWEVAQGIGVAGDLALPWWLLVTVAPVALALAATGGAGPGPPGRDPAPRGSAALGVSRARAVRGLGRTPPVRSEPPRRPPLDAVADAGDLAFGGQRTTSR